MFPGAVITADADSVGFGTGPGYQHLVCTLLPYTMHVTIGLARGTELADPAGLLEGSGPGPRSSYLARFRQNS